MKPKQRIIVVNAGVVGGLVISYFLGKPLWIIALCGIFLLVLANVVALNKIRKDQAKATVSN